MLLILFGLLGSGKNYVGGVLRDDYGMTFYDADTDLPADMREAIVRREVVPDEVRDRFFSIVVERLAHLRLRHSQIAGAQALYKEKHRQLIHHAFPDARFILVQTASNVLEARLSRRNDRFVDVEYARKIAPLFDPPAIPHFVLTNDSGRHEIRTQLDRILEAISASS